MAETAETAGTDAVRRSRPWVSLGGLSLLGVVIAALSVRALMQRAPSSIADLDLSWQLSLGVALADHLRFGTQYLFTYGPLGFLHVSMVYPSPVLTYTAAVLAMLGLAVYATGMLVFADRVRRSLGLGYGGGVALLAGTALVALLTAIAANLGTVVELLALVGITTCLLRPHFRGAPYLALGSGFALAVGALFKTDLLAVAVLEPAILIVVAWFLPGRPMRLPALMSTGLVLSYLAIWVGCGQSLGNLPAFWRGSWELSAGYSSAMSGAVNWSTVAGLALLVMALAITPVLLRHPWRSALTVPEAALALSIPWVIVSWKDGLVRINGPFDGRALALFGALLGVAWLVLLARLLPFSRLTMGPLMACAVSATVIVGILLQVNYQPWSLTALTRPATSPPQVQPSAYQIPSATIQSLRDHTVNALPWDIALVINNHLSWDPLPEPQTYSAYTPYLDHLDAAQLMSTGGAQRLVVSLTDIDGRYLFWDPPAVWDTVMSRYSCLSTTGVSAVLARRRPTVGPSRLVSSEVGAIGEWLRLPSTGSPYEFLDLHLSSSALGHAADLLLRQSGVYAMLRLSTGATVGPVRLVAATAGDGIYISHYITTPKQLCEVLGGRAGGVPRITAIELTSPHQSEWIRRYTVRVLAAN